MEGKCTPIIVSGAVEEDSRVTAENQNEQRTETFLTVRPRPEATSQKQPEKHDAEGNRCLRLTTSTSSRSNGGVRE